MSAIVKTLTKFARDEQGATAIEYGLLAAGIGVVIMGTVFLIGPELKTMFEGVNTTLSARPT
jgi:pilus assembly protein Flp/PilA